MKPSLLVANESLTAETGSRFSSPTRSPSTFSLRRPQRHQHAKWKSSPFGPCTRSWAFSVARFLAVSVFVCWLTSTLLQQRRLRARQEEAWQEILDDAEVYTTTLRCPVALVSAADLLAFGCLTQFEVIRDSGKQRVLDTMEKIADFRKEFVIVFLSHHWLAWTSPDPQGVHHKTMMAAVDRVSDMANVHRQNLPLG